MTIGDICWELRKLPMLESFFQAYPQALGKYHAMICWLSPMLAVTSTTTNRQFHGN